ncbi:lysozyme inhibitor LprI family protein [Collimonas fungivorans]|uniref:lysozyme inhibitor LprI family protein n=1 Tax=Collimonas fungivorans TaxID=158899 RepID=UPI0011D1A81B|nr:lysozyme inhibitor LprI family protein [Collimonas fungivorans]
MKSNYSHRPGCLLLALCVMGGAPAFAAAPAQDRDKTADALDACLSSEKTVSTADQTDCYATALKTYDNRLNAAYRKLMRTLPAPAAQNLRASQRAWIVFRDAELQAQSALFETRHGTIYVPMQEYEGLALTQERALRLESYNRVFDTDGP